MSDVEIFGNSLAEFKQDVGLIEFPHTFHRGFLGFRNPGEGTLFFIFLIWSSMQTPIQRFR